MKSIIAVFKDEKNFIFKGNPKSFGKKKKKKKKSKEKMESYQYDSFASLSLPADEQLEKLHKFVVEVGSSLQGKEKN
jgi:hypothetical protein